MCSMYQQMAHSQLPCTNVLEECSNSKFLHIDHITGEEGLLQLEERPLQFFQKYTLSS
jgi:hypothetical protein